MLFLAEMMAGSGVTAGKGALTVGEEKKKRVSPNCKTHNCACEPSVNSSDFKIRCLANY